MVTLFQYILELSNSRLLIKHYRVNLDFVRAVVIRPRVDMSVTRHGTVRNKT